MSYKLFIDDVRMPVDAYYYTGNMIFTKEGWSIVRSYDEFVKFIEANGVPELVSFDHDLADVHYSTIYEKNIDYQKYEKTGYHCAKWLCEYCMDKNIKFPRFLVHSMNTVGAENIEKYIYNYKKHVENSTKNN